MGEHGNLLISVLGYLVRPAIYGSDRKESASKVGDPGLIPGSEDPLEKQMATHSSISCLENSQDSTVHVVTKSQTGLSH